MYVYVESERHQLYTVGFYSPNGEWQPESDHTTEDEAAARVNYLNGGPDGAIFRYMQEQVARLEVYVSELRYKAGITKVDELYEQSRGA